MGVQKTGFVCDELMLFFTFFLLTITVQYFFLKTFYKIKYNVRAYLCISIPASIVWCSVVKFEYPIPIADWS